MLGPWLCTQHCHSKHVPIIYRYVLFSFPASWREEAWLSHWERGLRARMIMYVSGNYLLRRNYQTEKSAFPLALWKKVISQPSLNRDNMSLGSAVVAHAFFQNGLNMIRIVKITENHAFGRIFSSYFHQRKKGILVLFNFEQKYILCLLTLFMLTLKKIHH